MIRALTPTGVPPIRGNRSRRPCRTSSTCRSSPTRVEVSGTETITYTQEWNAENRLSVVTNTVTGDVTRWVYDGDGARVLRETPGSLTAYVGTVEIVISGTQRLTTSYYFAGGQRIAMRQGETLTYLHGDHLGSASLATDENGAQVSALRYLPYGETRYGDAPTDRRYTGQRYDSALGLYDYQARYYAPGLGRFISADSLVPNPANPQSLNRYSYVLNNPLRYTDPSGYFTTCDQSGQCVDNGYSVDNPVIVSHDADERRYQLLLYNNALAEWAKKGWITDLDAFVQLVNAAASMIPQDVSGDRTHIFVNDVAAVLTEFVDARYYNQSIRLKQSGFASIFQDPGMGGEQPHHFWFYVYAVFTANSRLIATVGNLAHETFLTAGTFSFRELGGRSYQDFALGQEAVNLGVDLRNGRIDIGQVGGYIENRLGSGSIATRTWGDTFSGRFNKKFYDLCLSSAALLWPIPSGDYHPR